MPLARTLILLFWAAFVIYWALAAAGAKKSLRSGARWRAPALRVACLAGLALVLAVPAVRGLLAKTASVPPAPAVAGLGAAFCLAGLAFAVWARRHLGRNWGIPMSLREEHELVTTGPYRLARHPIYSGLLLAMLGSALALGLVWLVPLAVFAGYFLLSAKIEERLMLRQFPERYPAYKKRTRMLIPFVF